MVPHLPAAMFVVLGAASFAAGPVNYDDDVKPIFRRHCLKCHGDDMQKADLNLQSYETALKGGSGGKVLVAGRASASPLFEAITAEEPGARMPPNAPPLPEKSIEVIRVWIQEGLRRSAGSAAATPTRDLTFRPADAGTAPDGPPPMPADLPAVEMPATARPLPALALDASPRAPLLAVAGFEHIRLIHTETRQPLGVLPFPEGIPHVLRFSRDGTVLLAAGGRPVQSGQAVLYDVRTGKRLAAFGDELDAVLAADLSPDQQLVAIGGSGKVVKVYATTDGALQYKLTKHTDWITSVAFSPNGATLATADRAGGLHLWEARGGGITLTLAEHKSAVKALHWRSDSRLLASAGEDGLLVWWDAQDGWPAIAKPNAHPPARPAGTYGTLRNGVLSASFGPQGDLLTAGRDRVVRHWKVDGAAARTFAFDKSLPLTTRISHDGQLLIAGDSAGEIHFWPVPE